MPGYQFHDPVTGRTRRVRISGKPGIQLKPKPGELEQPLADTPPLPPQERMARRAAVRELTFNSPEQLAKREVLKRIPIQKLIAACIEQGLFDRLTIDG